MGSSPRMRGKLLCMALPTRFLGLIPAHAGKTSFFLTDTPRPTAHPRACGENVPIAADAIAPPGSSPRMRGKLRGKRFQIRGERLIPAHAGKTT